MLRQSRCRLEHVLLVTALRIAWIAVVLWYELGIFWFALRDCQWPDEHPMSSIPNPSAVHVLVVTDPQILDRHSYPGRSVTLTLLTQFIVDIDIRRSWRAALRTRPHAVIFLGDLMDGGRTRTSSQEYEGLYKRFKSIFSISSSIPTYYLPGNHDVGLGTFPSSADARQRFTSHFGPLNQHFHLGNHSIIMIDALRLVDSSWGGEDHDETVKFIQNFGSAEKEDPVILFSHIPLWRPDNSSCGPLRERGTIRQGVGLGYQNTLGRETTAFILANIRPSAVFSGDDHDYCEYSHVIRDADVDIPTNHPPIKEITVKSFSMAMGILRPGFQMLSLHPESQTHASIPCDLPSRLHTLRTIYGPLVVISVLVLLASGMTRKGTGPGILPQYQETTEDANDLSYPMRNRDGKWRSPDIGRESLSGWETTGPAQGLNRYASYLPNVCCQRRGRSRRKGSFTGLVRDLTSVAGWPVYVWFLLAFWTFFVV